MSRIVSNFKCTDEQQFAATNRTPDLQGEVIPLRLAHDLISFAFLANALKNIPFLPAPYGLKGCAARHILSEARQESEKVPVRDIDIVRLFEGDEDIDEELARAVMPDDFAHGHGVEVCTDISRFMFTRDFTMSQVVPAACTRSCFRD